MEEATEGDIDIQQTTFRSVPTRFLINTGVYCGKNNLCVEFRFLCFKRASTKNATCHYVGLSIQPSNVSGKKIK